MKIAGEIRRAGCRPILLLFLLLAASCSIDDERDLCCEWDTVRFRYMYRGTNRFTEYISRTRYFLFDGEGRFVREMERMACCPARVDISTLEAGSYTLVCVGNLDDYGTAAGHVEGGLEAFRLDVDDLYDASGTLANGDRLYWGECRFTKVRGGMNNFTGEMANVHCHLRVRVEWELLPEHPDGYSFRLEGVGPCMELHGGNATMVSTYAIPPVTGYAGNMQEDVPLRRLTLEASLYTLRWGENDIPRFRLWHDGQPASKEVDLGMVFRRWGWRPERTPVQEYRIRLLIRADGSIEVNQGLEADVNDWENGGQIG